MFAATRILNGVDVCGTTSTTVYSYDQLFMWEDYGLKLYIQAKSLPEGVQQCTINITASLSGQYKLPENSHLMSAIFWFQCEPFIPKFKNSIKAEIQHCAKTENASKLGFVRALCNQEHLPYTFKELESQDKFSTLSSFGIVSVRRFSGIGIVQYEESSVDVDREYISGLYYLNYSISSYDIHFIVMMNTKVHINVSATQ